jgi:hypothetical protein
MRPQSIGRHNKKDRAMTNQKTRLIPATRWAEFHAWPPIGGLRHLIFNANSNGFDSVIRRIGRRVLIDEAAFFAWVDQNGGRDADR